PEKPATADEPSLGWVEGGEVEVVRRREKAPSPEGSPERLTEKRISREVETFLKRTSFQEFEDEPLIIPGVDVPAEAETKPEIAPTDTQPAAYVEVSRVEESRQVAVDAAEVTPSEQVTPQKELPAEVEKQEADVTPTPVEPPVLTPTETLPAEKAVTNQVEVREEITVKATTVEPTDKTVPDNQLAEKVEEVKEVIRESESLTPTEAPVSQKVEEGEGETVKLREKPRTEEQGSPDRLTEKRISREIETFLKRTSFQEFEDEPLVIPGLDEPAEGEVKVKPEIAPTEVAPPEPKESKERPEVTQELKEVSKLVDETPKLTPTDKLPTEPLINEQVVEVREDVVKQSLSEVAPIEIEQPGPAEPAERKELDEVKTEDLLAKQVEEVREDVKVAQPGPAVPEQVTSAKEVTAGEEPVKLREKPQTKGSPELTEKRISREVETFLKRTSFQEFEDEPLVIPGLDDVTISGAEAKAKDETTHEEVKIVAPGPPPVQKVEEPSKEVSGEVKEIVEPAPSEPVKTTVSKEEIKTVEVKDVKEPEVEVKEIPQKEPAVTESVITPEGKEIKEEVVSKEQPEIEVVQLREKRKPAESPEGLTEKRISREVETFLKRTSFQEFEDEPLVIPGLDQPEDKTESKPEIPVPPAVSELQPEAVSPSITQPEVDRTETVEVQPIPADSKVVHVVEPKETVEDTVTEEQIVTDDGVVTRIVKTTRTEVVTGSSAVVEEKPIVIEKSVSDKPTVSEGEVGIVVKPSEEQ
ncbi:neurofilament heavy polypeptide-like, partial [Branchiostoma lanceolatum]|uniref:neurofilament heavy polypeptide-like n=1 Tax=Branchiostoma lanceolatum TaxID=7740 RepID=UPI0034540D2F